VKLDLALVRSIETDPMRQALVTGLRYFASRTGCTLIAEGVETEPERQALSALGVIFGQGYLLGRPAAPKRVAA
jgi:EAL domain-containing protein (putative c-di-GMP-specific phosphodiesterase class I)